MQDAEDHKNLIIPAERVPIAAYQAIYHRLTGRVETISRQYGGEYLVTIEALESLYHKLDQASRQYQVQGSRCEYTISTLQGEIYRFTSLDKLRFANLRVLSSPVIAVGVELDLLVVLPSEIEEGENIPQRYRVLVTIEDERRRASRRSARILALRFDEPALSAGTLVINYSDYAVGRNLLNIVEEWFNQVEFVDEETISPAMFARLDQLSNWISTLLPIGFVLGAIFLEPKRYPDVITPIRYLLFVLLITAGTIAVALAANDKADTLLSGLVTRTRFDLSGGDLKLHQVLLRQRRSAKMRLTLLFTGVFLAGLVGFFVNYISKVLFGS